MIKIDKKLTKLAHVSSNESVPVPDVSASVMNTLANINTLNGGDTLRLWFMVASIAASFVMMLLAYRMQSADTFSDLVNMVSWAV